MAFLIVLAVLAVFVVLAIGLGVRTVPQGQVWTVERFGAFTRLLNPGLNLMLPFVEQVGHKMNVQEIVQDIPEQAVITRDNAAVLVDGIMYYRVLDPVKAAYGAQNLVQALTSMSMTNIRSVIGAMDLDTALSGREEINAKLLSTLDHATAPWGVKVSRVELRKIEPPANLVAAMNLQMTAERERRATVARAMGEREAAVARAEGAKQATVLEAEARLEAARRTPPPASAWPRPRPTRPAPSPKRPQAPGPRRCATSSPRNTWTPWAGSPPTRTAARWSSRSRPAASPAASPRPSPRCSSASRKRRPPPAVSEVAIWLVAGLVLCAAEMVAPGLFLLWIGLAACGTGALTAALRLGLARPTRRLRRLMVALIGLAAWRIRRRPVARRGERAHRRPDRRDLPRPRLRSRRRAASACATAPGPRAWPTHPPPPRATSCASSASTEPRSCRRPRSPAESSPS